VWQYIRSAILATAWLLVLTPPHYGSQGLSYEQAKSNRNYTFITQLRRIMTFLECSIRQYLFILIKMHIKYKHSRCSKLILVTDFIAKLGTNQGWTRVGSTRGSGRVGSKFLKCIIFFLCQSTWVSLAIAPNIEFCKNVSKYIAKQKVDFIAHQHHKSL